MSVGTSAKPKYKKRSQIAMIWRRFVKNRMAMIGLILFAIMLIIAVVSPLFINYETDVIQQTISERFMSPSAEHLFGTDQFGRDIFSRVLWGARISMSVGVAVVIISLIIGSILGLWLVSSAVLLITLSCVLWIFCWLSLVRCLRSPSWQHLAVVYKTCCWL